MSSDLEEVVTKRRKIVETVMHKFLGVSIKELNDDITSKLSNPFEYIIDTSIEFKKAKKLFIKSFIEKLLRKNHGNISETAKDADVDRRSIHRFILEHNIDVEQIRKFSVKPYYTEKEEVGKIIETTLKKYDDVIHPKKLDKMYENLSVASDDIVKILPDKSLTLKDSEEQFELRYLLKALSENEDDEKKTSEKVKIRYETLHRKLQFLKKKYNDNSL